MTLEIVYVSSSLDGAECKNPEYASSVLNSLANVIKISFHKISDVMVIQYGTDRFCL